MSERLKHVQLEFVTSLLHPDAEQRLLGALVGDETNNRERVARYRARLWRTWHRVLACAYPVLRSLMGDDFFLTLSREYGIADPIRSGDLNRFGSRMAELLEAWPPTATCRHLADVARLEWLVHRACFAADATAGPMGAMYARHVGALLGSASSGRAVASHVDACCGSLARVPCVRSGVRSGRRRPTAVDDRRPAAMDAGGDRSIAERICDAVRSARRQHDRRCLRRRARARRRFRLRAQLADVGRARNHRRGGRRDSGLRVSRVIASHVPCKHPHKNARTLHSTPSHRAKIPPHPK